MSNNTAWVGEGTSSYHALNVSLVKRVTHGLAFKANYSYSKVMDLNSAILAPSGENEPADVFSPTGVRRPTASTTSSMPISAISCRSGTGSASAAGPVGS